MPRGGHRVGAGRKSKHGELTVLKVGGRCEELWRQAWTKKLDDAITKQTRHTRTLFEEQAGAVPISDRASIDEDTLDDYRAEVIEALRRDQGIPDDEEIERPDDPTRLLHFLVPRPKGGERTQIISQVAVEFGLSKGFVEKQWKAFRRIQKRLDTD